MKVKSYKELNVWKKGFTLLEVLITIIILTIGVIALTSAFSSGILAATDAENVDLALNIAQAKMEEIKNAGYASLADSGPAAADTDPNSPLSRFDVTVDAGVPADPRQVDVTVEWEAQSGVKHGQIPSVSITLTTQLANY